MRDKRFVAEHRGGLLKKEHHKQLMLWAVTCAEHLIPLLGENQDERLKKVLAVALKWTEGIATVGEARKAAVEAIAVANETSDPVKIAVARAVGHTVATAHMSDHSLGSALYGMRAMKNAGGSPESEREWQNEQLPSEIMELVLSGRSAKEKHFKV